MTATPIHEGLRLFAEVVERHDLAPEHPSHIQLSLAAPSIAERARPGQFVHVLPPSVKLILRRPFSLLSTDPARGLIAILFRVVGEGTRLLAASGAGDSLDIIGPLGNGFPIGRAGPALIVGGGVGIPPLVFLTESLLLQRGSPADVRVHLGAKDRAALICTDEFRALGIEPILATEDGSAGLQGLVTDALPGPKESMPPKTVIYACGPIGMLKAVARWASDRALTCYVSLENKLACGIGACLGCSIPVRSDDRSIRYERVCCDGPVFEAGRVAFDLM